MSKKNTRRALLSSAIALLLCVSMLVGSTFAWFTDEVTSAGNKIQSGTLKVDLKVLDTDNTTWTSVKESKDPIFTYDKWEPGYTEMKIMRVVNEGTLALKWQAALVSTAELSELAEVIDVYVKEDVTAYPTDRTDLEGWTKVGTLDTFINSIETTTTGEIKAGANEVLGIAFKMKENAGNEYQDLTLGAFDIQILATQLTYEKDSFDENYDAGAYLHTVTTAEELKAALEDNKSVKLGADIVLTGEWTPIGNKDEGIYYTGTLDGNGHTISGLTVSEGDYVALISAAKDATVKNLTVEGTVSGENAAGIVARAEGNTVIEDCVNNAVVKGTTKAGGIACNVTGADARIVNCTNGANISGGNSGVGGIVGYANNDTYLEIINCTNNGSVTSGKYAGAAVGYAAKSKGIVIDFTNNVAVTGQMDSNNRFLMDGDTLLVGYQNTEGNWVLGTSVSSGEDIIAATDAKVISLSGDITYQNTDPEKQMILVSAGSFEVLGNGATITVTGADPAIGNHGYVGFVPAAGEDAVVSDLTVTGTGFVEVGHWGMGGGDYVVNDLTVKDLTSTLANGDKGFVLACGFCHYGSATLNDCVMTGTTAMIEGAMPVDAGFVNDTTTVVNGGKYGTVYCWSHSVVTINGAEIDTVYVAPIKGSLTIAAGTKIGTLNINYTSANVKLDRIIVEDGATIDTVIYDGVTYTWAEWQDR